MLARNLMLSLVSDFQQNKPLALNPQFVHGIRSILTDSTLDKVCIIWCQVILFRGNINELLIFVNGLHFSGVHCEGNDPTWC